MSSSRQRWRVSSLKKRVASVVFENASGECQVRVDECQVASSKFERTHAECRAQKTIGEFEKASVELKRTSCKCRVLKSECLVRKG